MTEEVLASVPQIELGVRVIGGVLQVAQLTRRLLVPREDALGGRFA